MLQSKKTLAKLKVLYYNIIVGKDIFAVSIYFQEEKNMRNLKKFLALVLSLVMAAGAVSTFATAAKFTDVSASDETLTKAVDLLSSVGITTGTTETTFGTSENVTRQQMATFIYRLMKAGKTVEGGTNSTTFTDLDDPFYYFMISWANDMGIIKGRSATSFDPKGKIILQDAYVMIVRALGYEAKEALEYPFGYIAIAEEIGLDDGLPSSVTYDKALTRGNVAILLYNAFYADMATGETAYEIEYEEVELTGGKLAIVEKGMTPYTDYDTVAEDIFGIKNTVQRIVATPNYAIDEFEKTDDSKNDTEMVTLECFDKDSLENGDDGLFSEVEFASLGLSGKADDYFLMDLSIFYKKEAENKAPEIVSASSLGNVKKNVAGSKVKFDVNSNLALANSSEARFNMFTGKVTVDGTTSYLFNAPWSYSKPTNVEDKDDECITLVWLAPSDRDPEEEDYVPDFNFKSDRDVLGRGAETYSKQSSTIYNKANGSPYTVKESYNLAQKDLRGVGLYTPGGLYMSTLIDLHLSTNYEVDVWDSNGDGKIDYMWMKPYAIGQLDMDEGEPFMTVHNGGKNDSLDNYAPIYEAGKVPTIYGYGANYADGAKPVDKKVAIGYFNGPANYMRIISLTDLVYKDMTFTGRVGSDSNNISLNGSSRNIWGGNIRLIGIANQSGARSDYANSPSNIRGESGPFQSKYFSNTQIGNEYQIAEVSGFIFHMKGATNQIKASAEYALIFPNTNGAYAYTTSVGVVTDGNLQKTGNYLQVMVEGELQDVIVKPQTSASVASKNPQMPVTPKQKNGVYDFTEYVGKLLTYTINADGEYVFRIAPLDENTDDSVLATEEQDVFYTYESDEYGKVTAAFVHARNNLYQFVKKGTNELHSVVAPSRYVSVNDDTTIVIKTFEDDEEVFTVYTAEDLPKFSEDVDFKSIKYIVRNNPNSTTIEELVYLYAESADGKVADEVGNTLDYRFVHAHKAIKDEDTVITYYDVFNPFTGKIEEEYEAYNEDATIEINGIYSLTASGYINDEALLGRIDELGDAAVEGTDLKTKGLGLVALDDYDDTNGLLAIDGYDILFQVTDDTVISFLDLDEGTMTLKTDDILSSTSKAYRCNDNKDIPLLAFVVSTEIEKEDDLEEAKVIVIVRYDDIDIGQ